MFVFAQGDDWVHGVHSRTEGHTTGRRWEAHKAEGVLADTKRRQSSKRCKWCNGNGIRAYLDSHGFALTKDIFKKMDGSFDASKLPWHVPFVLNRFEKWALNNCGKLWLRLLTSRDDFLCCAKKTAAARFLSPSSSRNLAKSTHLQNKHCHKIRSWSRAFHKRNLFNSFLLFFFSYWFVFHCFPSVQGHLIIGLWPWRWSAATQLNYLNSYLGWTSKPDGSHRSVQPRMQLVFALPG